MLMNFLYFFVLNIDKRKLIVFFASVSIVLSIAVFNKSLHNQYESFYDNSKFLVTNLNKFHYAYRYSFNKRFTNYEMSMLDMFKKYQNNGKKINFSEQAISLLE